MKPPHLQNRRAQLGFTLLELIVAVSILAIIAVLSWRGLDAVLHTRDSLNQSQARSDELQRGFNRLERDALLAKEVRLFPGGRFRLIASNETAVEYQFADDILMRRVLNAATDAQGAAESQEQQVLLAQLQGIQVDLYKKASDGKGDWSDLPTTQLLAPPVPTLGSNPGSAVPAAGPPSPVAAPVGGNGSNSLPVATGFDFRPVTGLRIILNQKQGGVIQRIFLLGSTA